MVGVVRLPSLCSTSNPAFSKPIWPFKGAIWLVWLKSDSTCDSPRMQYHFPFAPWYLREGNASPEGQRDERRVPHQHSLAGRTILQ